MVLLGATVCWAVGSVWSRHLRQPASALLTVAMQMIAGGVILIIGGLSRANSVGFTRRRSRERAPSHSST
jgi:drug/metabolite transporter (DMT)-like permease